MPATVSQPGHRRTASRHSLRRSPYLIPILLNFTVALVASRNATKHKFGPLHQAYIGEGIPRFHAQTYLRPGVSRTLPSRRRRRRGLDRRGRACRRPRRGFDRSRSRSRRVLLRPRRTLHARLPPLRMEAKRRGGPSHDCGKLEDLSDRGGVGLTPHAVVLDRALAAVAVVNEIIEKMGSTGELQDLNAKFKAARKADPSVKYSDYVEARKAAMLEALARA